MSWQTCIVKFSLCLLIISLPSAVWSSSPVLTPFAASPDQVLVIYNKDWENDGKDSNSGQDSKEIAEYYVSMHTDPETGKKPYILGLSCAHGKKHLNHRFLKEDSNDNKNGVIFTGKGRPPDTYDWIRASGKVEICIDEQDADWNSLIIKCVSELSGEEKIVYPIDAKAGGFDFNVSGIPQRRDYNVSYPPLEDNKGRCYKFDASKIFSGTVKISFKLKNKNGMLIRDLSLNYYDIKDFQFSPAGRDNISDEKNLEEDVLSPVKTFLTDPANALPDGTLLKDHMLYIVVVHGMPYAANGVFGIEHGTTPHKRDHGALASLEQRLQSLYYGWHSSFRPPVISMYMSEGPDSKKGVVNNIITTAMRHPLYGIRWNPYMHPDTYSYLARDKKRAPVFYNLQAFQQQRKTMHPAFFAYAVTRIDGSNAEETKRIIDYSIYATKYLRPEMDCYVRKMLKKENRKEVNDMAERLKKAEDNALWGDKELEALGFRVVSNYDNGLPFMVRPVNEPDNDCSDEKPEWKDTGFYPGGMGRGVVSHNGWNMKTGPIWEYVKNGVTVSACGAPAYDGGPHITNATFWDNRILIRYLFRGRDLGESLLRSTYYTNWSTSLIGDPLMHPDLTKTVIDKRPPSISNIDIKAEYTKDGYAALIKTELKYDPINPEVAMLKFICTDNSGTRIEGAGDIYSRRPHMILKDLKPDTDYTCRAIFIDPYGNRTEVSPVTFKTEGRNFLKDLMLKLRESVQ